MTRNLLRTVLAGCALLLAGTARAAEPVSDQELVGQVLRSIQRYPELTVFDDVRFQVQGGEVRLVGSVYKAYRRTDLEQRVAKLPGVTGVQNDLIVQPVSISDDQTRVRLYRRIYGNLQFAHYGAGSLAPIRIVVSYGNVTLLGSVTSRVDQAMLGMIALEEAPFRVDNQIQVERGQPKEPLPVGGRQV